jgi:hypothetical protein
MDTIKNKVKKIDLTTALLIRDSERLLYDYLGVSEETQYQYIQDSSLEELELRHKCVIEMVKLLKEIE